MDAHSEGNGRVPSVRQDLGFLLVIFSPLSLIFNHMTCLGVSVCAGTIWDWGWPNCSSEAPVLVTAHWIAFAPIMRLVCPLGRVNHVSGRPQEHAEGGDHMIWTHRQPIGSSGSRLSHSSLLSLKWKKKSSNHTQTLTSPYSSHRNLPFKCSSRMPMVRTPLRL